MASFRNPADRWISQDPQEEAVAAVDDDALEEEDLAAAKKLAEQRGWFGSSSGNPPVVFDSKSDKEVVAEGPLELFPSEFVAGAFRITQEVEKGIVDIAPFTFKGRRHMIMPYNTPARRVLLVTARQVEKTCAVTALVARADGSLVPAGEVVLGERLACLDASSRDARMTTAPVEWISRRYFKPCVRLRTRRGHAVDVATTHPLRLFGRWVEAGDVRVGDRVAALVRSGVFLDEPQPTERVELTSFLLGDGSMPRQAAISFTGIPGPVVDRFRACLAAIGATYTEQGKTGTAAVDTRVHLHPQLADWLSVDGLFGTKSATKFFPEWVFRLPRAQTALFINRLWSTDGHVKQNGPSKYSIEYCSMSRLMVRQLQSLLWKFGIPSSIRENWPAIYKQRGERRFAHILRVESQEGVRAFLTEIGALGKSVDVALPTRDANNNRYTLPVELNALIGRVDASRGRTSKKSAGSLFAAGLRVTPEYPLTPGKLARYVEFFENDGRCDQELLEELRAHVDSDLYWDTVESIEDLGELECVDFSVEDHHNFVVDGVVTHNSTLLGNLALTYSCLVQGHRTLYVSPSATQTKTFSNDRLREPLEMSPLLKAFTTPRLSMNVFQKQFVNWSQITLRYAYLTADRTRGIPAWMLLIDEIQDIIGENIPVIEQCTAHAPEIWKRYRYSGTPKTTDNIIEHYRAKQSTQGEWVVPCDSCGSAAGAGRYWNILGEKNIGLKYLICEKCGKQIHPQHDDAQWGFQVDWDEKLTPFESYRIPQLMVPWKPWSEILHEYTFNSRDRFYNEVLGLAYDEGTRPLTPAQVRACCDERLSMSEEHLEAFQRLAQDQPVFAGIDWGCHDEETRILTERGFVHFRDLLDEDRVAQWDPDTREVSFVPPLARTVRRWDRPLWQFSTRGGVDLRVTDTHRMRVKTANGSWATEPAASTVRRTGQYSFVGHVAWKGEEVPTFTLPGQSSSPGYAGEEARVFAMDDWLALFGYLVTEGGLCWAKITKGPRKGERRPACLKMSQRASVNAAVVARIRGLLQRLGVPHTEFPNDKTTDINWTIYGKAWWAWYRDRVGLYGDEKRIPREFLRLSARQLRILFDAMVDGDGSRDPRVDGARGSYSSTSRGLCEDFQEICIKLGLRAVLRLHAPAEGNRKARWRVSWAPGKDYILNADARPVEVPYSGNVYCCAVPSGYIVTERNGCISYQGNTGENTYTVITLATYVDMRFTVFYAKRFIGEELNPELQLDLICDLINLYNVELVGTDYGGGYDRNDHLIRKFGPDRIQKFQLLGRNKAKVDWNPKFRRWQGHRSEVMSDIFNAIKRKTVFTFPRWAEFAEPFAQDMCNIFSEYSESLRITLYDHHQDSPDDTFHSLMFNFLVSMIRFPRPDVIAPRRETDHEGGGQWQESFGI